MVRSLAGNRHWQSKVITVFIVLTKFILSGSETTPVGTLYLHYRISICRARNPLLDDVDVYDLKETENI